MQLAGIAQLVEHLIRNEGVRGSNPRTGTSFPVIVGWQSLLFPAVNLNAGRGTGPF